MTPIAYALAVYHEARRRVWQCDTGIPRCGQCVENLGVMVAHVIREAKAVEEAARRRKR
jgi:hypothetical protein